MSVYKGDKGKYDVPFDEKQLSLDIQTFLKNINDKNTYSDEQMMQIKKKLNDLSGEFINSLNDSLHTKWNIAKNLSILLRINSKIYLILFGII